MEGLEMKDEALKLAEFLDTLHETNESDYGSADMIRKLVAVIDLDTKIIEQQIYPLSDEEILDVYNYCFETMDSVKIVDFARAIEERHGIK
mgnify:CR=1 FL=1